MSWTQNQVAAPRAWHALQDNAMQDHKIATQHVFQKAEEKEEEIEKEEELEVATTDVGWLVWGCDGRMPSQTKQ